MGGFVSCSIRPRLSDPLHCTSLSSAGFQTSPDHPEVFDTPPSQLHLVSDVFATLPPQVTHVKRTIYARNCRLVDVEGALDWSQLQCALRHYGVLRRVDVVLRLQHREATLVAPETGDLLRARVFEGIMERIGSQLRSLAELTFEDCYAPVEAINP